MGPVRFSAGMAASCICRGDEQGVGGRRLASAEERKTNKLLARRGESLKSSSETESLLKTEDVTWVSVLELPTWTSHALPRLQWVSKTQPAASSRCGHPSCTGPQKSVRSRAVPTAAAASARARMAADGSRADKPRAAPGMPPRRDSGVTVAHPGILEPSSAIEAN